VLSPLAGDGRYGPPPLFSGSFFVVKMEKELFFSLRRQRPLVLGGGE